MRAALLALAGAIVLGWTARAEANGKHRPPPPAPAPAPEAEPAPPPPPAGDTYAIVSIDIAGDADPGLKPAIAASVARGLEHAGAAQVGADVVAQALRAKPELVGCTSTTCLAKLGAVVGASRFVTARVDTAGAAYNVELTVLTGDGPVARNHASCEVCTMSDLGDLLAKKAEELITQPTAPPIAITLATTPGGGEVAVSDGTSAGPLRPVGKAPAQITLAPGNYLVEVKLAGYAVLRKTITVADNAAPQAFELTLTPSESDDGGPRWKTWKWVVGGGAAAALFTGIVVLSYDGKGACGSPPCVNNYESTAQGFALIGVGVAAGAAAGWMFWQDRREAHHARAMVAPAPGGASAAVTIDF